jgi:chemotaxis protein methyltransferase CheR
MNYGDFSFIAGFLREKSGLIITPDKTYLIESRLAPIVREVGLTDIAQLIEAIRRDPASKLARAVVYAMTTNETMFFRDGHPFESLRKIVIPKLMERRSVKKVLRLWSAACSSGQEPYSLAMLLRENFPIGDWYINIVATDLNPAMLDRAREGYYSGFEVQRGMPIQYLMKYFDQMGDRWRMKQEIRDMVEFRKLDLLGDISALGVFDIVMCRNVLIYFEQAAKSKVMNSIAAQLASDGVFMLGGSESTFGLCDKYTDVPNVRGLYRLKADTSWNPDTAAGQKTVMPPPLKVIENK